jgi:hypothetical protein
MRERLLANIVTVNFFRWCHCRRLAVRVSFILTCGLISIELTALRVGTLPTITDEFQRLQDAI